jgi:hypothetical protein
MKRIAVIISIILFLIPNVINADENFAFRLGLLNIKLGITGWSPEGEDPGFAFSFDIISIGVEHINTRIGFEFSPARLWVSKDWYSSDSKDWYSSVSKGWNFINLNLYWNIIEYKLFQFGPFNRINYMYLTDKVFDWRKIINTLGIRVGLVSLEDYFVIKYFGVEFGYRITDRRNDFYLGFDMDFTAVGKLFQTIMWY